MSNFSDRDIASLSERITLPASSTIFHLITQQDFSLYPNRLGFLSLLLQSIIYLSSLGRLQYLQRSGFLLYVFIQIERFFVQVFHLLFQIVFSSSFLFKFRGFLSSKLLNPWFSFSVFLLRLRGFLSNSYLEVFSLIFIRL